MDGTTGCLQQGFLSLWYSVGLPPLRPISGSFPQRPMSMATSFFHAHPFLPVIRSWVAAREWEPSPMSLKLVHVEAGAAWGV